MSFLRLSSVIMAIMIIPFVSSTIFNDQYYSAYLLLLITFLLEYMAYPVGLMLGLKPIDSAMITLASTIGYFFLFYELLRIARNISKIKSWLIKIDESKWIKRIRRSEIITIPLAALISGVLTVSFLAWLMKLDLRKTTILTIISEILGIIIVSNGTSLVIDLLRFFV